MLILDDILNKINLDVDMKDIIDDNNPLESDSIGMLCYKLSCVTIQMWNNQESLYKIRKMNTEEFRVEYSESMDNLHKLIKRCCDLNYQRSLIMDFIDKKSLEMSHGHNR